MIKKTALLLLVSLSAQAEPLNIVIDRGVENSIPVAIIPFSWDGPSGTQPISLDAVIGSDLARSGRFTPMQVRDMPQQPVTFQAINFRDWRLLGMENIVIGTLKTKQDDNYEVEFRLVDIYQRKQIAGYRIPTMRAQLRRTAHRISDIIFEKLTGIPGAFNTRIAYITVKELANGRKQHSLQIADADGFRPQVLLESSEPLMSPSWSPDGKKLAYVSFEEKNSSVYIQDIITGDRQQIASHPGINSAPAWSPDGARLALTLSKDGNPEIYIVHLSSAALQRITQNRAIDTEPSWSPDGNKLVFTSDRGGTPQIYEVSARGGKAKRLSFGGSYFARPSYSPGGKSIIMVHGKDRRYRIAMLDLENHYLDILTENRLDESPSFSPNGSMILYTTTRGKGTELAAVSSDGRVHQRLALPDGEVREPDWGPLPRQ